MDSIAICRNCPRDAAESGVCGIELREAVQAELQPYGVDVLMVECLGSCRMPCSVALDAPSKYRVRFSGLDVHDARDLIGAAIEYSRSKTGLAENGGFTDTMQSKISAISPKRSMRPHPISSQPVFRSRIRST